MWVAGVDHPGEEREEWSGVGMRLMRRLDVELEMGRRSGVVVRPVGLLV